MKILLKDISNVFRNHYNLMGQEMLKYTYSYMCRKPLKISSEQKL